jgi:hypothetical protein
MFLYYCFGALPTTLGLRTSLHLPLHVWAWSWSAALPKVASWYGPHPVGAQLPLSPIGVLSIVELALWTTLAFMFMDWSGAAWLVLVSGWLPHHSNCQWFCHGSAWQQAAIVVGYATLIWDDSKFYIDRTPREIFWPGTWTPKRELCICWRSLSDVVWADISWNPLIFLSTYWDSLAHQMQLSCCFGGQSDIKQFLGLWKKNVLRITKTCSPTSHEHQGCFQTIVRYFWAALGIK